MNKYRRLAARFEYRGKKLRPEDGGNWVERYRAMLKVRDALIALAEVEEKGAGGWR